MSTWSDHVTAALLGTRRRPVPPLPGVSGATRAADDAETSVRMGTVDRTDAAGAGEAAGRVAPAGRARPSHAGDVTVREGRAAPAPGGDPAGRLLDQAALLTARRRAGRLAEHAEPVAPAPAETAPIVPPAAARRLGRILDGEQPRVLAEWLDAAARAGRRVPPRMLPALLDRGRTDRALRPSLARAAGRRGVWLAMRNLDWAYFVVAGGGAAAADPQVWETGTRHQRVAHLARSRTTEPAAALARLAGTWATEPAADRVVFLATLAEGLSPADEEFLEAALDDRGIEVRRVAADLLTRLTASAYARRMAVRARACLRVETHGGRVRLLALARPAAHDESMRRDGVPFHAAEPVGPRTGWTREIIARAPLATWTGHSGLSPARLVALPVADATDLLDPPTVPATEPTASTLPGPSTDPADAAPVATTGALPGTAPGPLSGRTTGTPPGSGGAAAGAGGGRTSRAHGPATDHDDAAGATGDARATADVHIGWTRAALRQRDPTWARALLAEEKVLVAPEELAALLDLLPPADRPALAAGLVHRAGPHADLPALLDRIPGPWTGDLADAVIAILADAARDAGDGRRTPAALCRTAAGRLVPAAASRVAEIAGSGAPSRPLAELAATLRFRQEMLEELR